MLQISFIELQNVQQNRTSSLKCKARNKLQSTKAHTRHERDKKLLKMAINLSVDLKKFFSTFNNFLAERISTKSKNFYIYFFLLIYSLF